MPPTDPDRSLSARIARLTRYLVNHLDEMLERVPEGQEKVTDLVVLADVLAALRDQPAQEQPRFDLDDAQVQLIAWAVVNCHTLARRALARSTSVYDREKWEHVLRICEKAGARSQGVLRASVPTELTEGAALRDGGTAPHATELLQRAEAAEDQVRTLTADLEATRAELEDLKIFESDELLADDERARVAERRLADAQADLKAANETIWQLEEQLKRII